MDRLNIINSLIEKNNYNNYLEIGVFTGYTLDGCIAKNKIGVDPSIEHYRGNQDVFKGTSDEFFSQLDKNKKFSLIFIDGLHEAEQVYRDIQNSLKYLSEGGTIVLHDCNPPLYEHTTTGVDGCWTGDTYKGVIKALIRFPVDLQTVDTDWGVGIMKPKSTPPPYLCPFPNVPSWDTFDEKRHSYLNLITTEEFEEIYIKTK